LNALTIPGGASIGGVWWNTSEEIAHNTGPKTTTTNFICEVNGPGSTISFNMWSEKATFDVAVANGDWSISVRAALVALPDNVAPLSGKCVNNTMIGLAKRLEILQNKN